MRNSPNSWLLAALLLLAGCSLAPEPAPPPGPIPETWAQAETSTAPLPAAWWRTFGSPDIDALVEGALAANRDLAAALARIEQARAGVRIAGAGLWPRIDAAGTATDTRQSGSGTLTAITGPGTTRIGSDSGTSYHGQLQVAYEADLFGRVRAGRDAARDRLAASAFDHQALRLVTAAEVVQTALELAATERRLELAAANLDNARALLALLDARLAAGRSAALERDQQRSAVAGLEAEIAALGESRAQQRHRLAVLSGAPSPDFAPPVPQWAQLRLPEVRPMVPAALLSQRPDLRRAEAELAAAGADLGAARAALYPSLEISLGSHLDRSLQRHPHQSRRQPAGADLSRRRAAWRGGAQRRAAPGTGRHLSPGGADRLRRGQRRPRRPAPECLARCRAGPRRGCGARRLRERPRAV